ncbi:MAG: hypothetical protein RR386_09605, partial [Bacteroidaceae bacterium]
MIKEAIYSIIKPFAFVFKSCPKFTCNIRRLITFRHLISWNNPKTLEDYAITILYNKNTNLRLYADLADKVAVRDYVKKTIGEKYTNKLYATWERAEDVDVTNLP